MLLGRWGSSIGGFMGVAVFSPVVGSSLMHPLDPLGVEEIARACHVVVAAKQLGPETRFAMVHF
jgi:Cu2+-containing amine oxidase